MVPEPPAEIPASSEEQLESTNEGQSARNTDAIPVEPPKSGGRLGSAATQAFNRGIAQSLEDQGYSITGGGGFPEEYIKGDGPGTKGSTYVDITAEQGDKTLRIQTIDTYADGSPTAREKAAEQRIRKEFPTHGLRLIPKPER